MKKFLKTVAALLLTTVMIVSLFPSLAFAEGEEAAVATEPVVSAEETTTDNNSASTEETTVEDVSAPEETPAPVQEPVVEESKEESPVVGAFAPAKKSTPVQEPAAPEYVITAQPQDAVVAPNTKAVFAVETNGKVSSYQWQYSTNGGKSWKNLSSKTYNKASISITASSSRSSSNNGYKYRCVVTFKDKKKTKATSEVATLYVASAQSFKSAKDRTSEDPDVSADAPAGTFPTGTTMSVEKVDAEDCIDAINEVLDGEADVLAAVDISFAYGGEEVEPANDNKVKVTLKDAAIKEGVKLVHVDDFGVATEIAEEDIVSIKEGEIVFYGDAFSIYAVIDDNDDKYARITVNFYNGSNLIETYYVKNGDALLGDNEREPDVSYLEDIVTDPGLGKNADGTPYVVPSDQTFVGWSMDDQMDKTGTRYTDSETYVGAGFNEKTKPMTIEGIRTVLADMNIKEGDIVNIYAMILKYYSVTYFGADHNGTIINTVTLGTDTLYLMPAAENTDYTVAMTYAADSHQNFKGWKPTAATAGNIRAIQKDENGEEILVALDIYPNNTKVRLTGNVVLNVEAPRGNWLVYDANARGATFNAPQFYLASENTEIALLATVAEMERNGYTLEERADGEPGWYTLKSEYKDANGDPVSAVPKEDGYLRMTDADIATYFEPFTFGGQLTDNVTIYARWVPKTEAIYTIIFHKQNVGRTGYDMAGSYVGKGRVGNAIPLTFVNNVDEDYVTDAGGTDRHYTGFCLNHSEENTLGTLQKTTGYTTVNGKQVPTKESVSIPTITAEGDAVLNVYFDRIEYEFRFYYYRDNGGGNNNRYSYAQNSNSYNGDGVYGVATWSGNGGNDNRPAQTYGADHTANIEGYTAHYFVLEAYYGQPISSLWPKYNQLGTVGPANDRREAVSFVMMNGTGLKKKINAAGTGTGRGSDTIKGTIEIMDEMILGKTNDADGNFVVIRYNTKNEWRYHILYEQAEGVDYSGYAIHDVSFGNDGKLYYEDHIYNSRSTNTDVTQQTAPQFNGFEYVGLSNQQGTTNPNNGRWETTESINNQNVTCYNIRFYYNRLEYPITFYDGNYVTGNDYPGTTDHNRSSQLIQEKDKDGNYIPKEEITIAHGAVVPDEVKNYTPPIQPGEEGYVFEGWYYDEACSAGAEYNFSDVVPVGGITVYAKWRQIRYRVFLHSEAFMIDSETGQPEVDEYGNKIYDDTLNWGSASQQMAFGIAYGGKVSLPDGTRDEYEFLGWFLDPEGTKLYTASTVLNEETVPAEPKYVKAATEADPDAKIDYTDYLDIHGNVDEELGTPYNSDADRFWVTRKLDLYGKWRKILVGADGIGVVYDIGELGDPDEYVPVDNMLYVQGASAKAQGASKPKEKTKYQFLYWVVQRWDAEAVVTDPETGDVIATGAYVDITKENGELLTVFPGDAFDVSMDFAKRVTNPDHTEEDPSYTYTMQLRAEYGPLEIPKNTYFNWYRNWDENDTPEPADDDPEHHGGLLHKDEELQINQAVTIYTLLEGNSIPTRPGYKFLGWARDTEVEVLRGEDGKIVVDEDGNPVKKPLTDPETGEIVYDEDGNKIYPIIAYHDGLDEDDLYIKWVEAAVKTDPETGDPVLDPDTEEPVIVAAHYEAKNKEGKWVPVTKAAADEVAPYQAYYAVWEARYFVYYTGSAKLYSYTLDDEVSFSNLTTGYLYGGYSSSYFGGYTVTADDMANASKAEDGYITIDTTKNATAIYNPDKTYVKGLTRWWKTAEMGKTAVEDLEPVGGTIYYVKEVPNKYLTTRIQYVFDWSKDDKISTIYLLTSVDEQNYTSVNFELAKNNVKEATLAGSFTFVQRFSEEKITTKVTAFTDVVRGFVGYADGEFTQGDDGFIAPNTVFTVTPFWVTPDNVRVDGTPRTFTTGADGSRSTIVEVTTP